MATTAERVVTELIADTSGHDPRIRTSARVVEQSATQIEGAARRSEMAVVASGRGMVRSFDQTAMRTRLLGFQIADVGSQLAAGTSPFLIIAQQAPQMANAMDGATGVAGRMASFFSGPWGAALLAAGSLLGVLAMRNREAEGTFEDASRRVAENARQTDMNRRAQEAFAATLPGVIAAIREQTEALRQQNLTIGENQQLAVNAARGRLAALEAMIGPNVAAQAQAIRDLTGAEAALARLRAGGERGLGPIATTVAEARARLQALRTENAQIQAAIAAARAAITEATIPVLQRNVETSLDEAAAATRRYEEALAGLNAQLRANQITEAQYQAQLTAAARTRDREIEASRQRERRSSAVDRTLIRPVSGAVLSQFGADRSGVPINGGLVAGRRHQGVDLRGAVGDPVLAPEGGTAFVRNAPGGLGLYVEIRADSGARNLLGHLSAARVQSGDRVTAGQLVGLVGASGNARGGTPHLHWQRQVGGRWADPMRAVGSSGAAQAALAASREPTAADLRARIEMAQELAEIARGMPPLEVLTPEQMGLVGDLNDAIEEYIRVGSEIPSLADGLLPREDQERLEDFNRDFRRDLVGGLVDAALAGRDLGEALMNSIRRAASELITSGLLDLLNGRGAGNTLIGNLLGFGTAAIGGGPAKVPGFATGLSMMIGGKGGIDNNLLSLNGQPIGRVSRGEGLHITPQGRATGGGAGSAAGGRPIFNVHQTFVLDARYGITTPQLLQHVNAVARDHATAAGVASYQRSMRDAPNAVRTASRFGQR